MGEVQEGAWVGEDRARGKPGGVGVLEPVRALLHFTPSAAQDTEEARMGAHLQLRKHNMVAT